MQRKEIIEKELSSYEGRNFLLYQSHNGQGVAEMTHQIREIFAENNLSIVEAKGFLDYMKLIVEFNPCTSGIQENNKNPENSTFNDGKKESEEHKEKSNPELPKGKVFTQVQRRVFGLKCRYEDESLIYEILKILEDKELSVDRVSRVLADIQSMLPILAKLPTK